jgi:hypothetical protein
MFKNAKVGDRVWHITKGFGKIVEIFPEATFPITVEFHGISRINFRYDGKQLRKDLNPTLFWDKIKFDIPKMPLPKLEVDTKVIVWDSSDVHSKYINRYFSHFNEDGRIVVFINGTTSLSNRGGQFSSYDNWELAK